MAAIRIVEGRADHIAGCMEVARELRDFFNDEALARMPADMAEQHLLVAVEGERVVGFLTSAAREDGSAEITWMGVRRDRQRQGVGTALLDRLVDVLSERGVPSLMVRTLDASAGYEPYEGTRAFYQAHGIRHVGTVPDWGPDDPCAVYRRPL